MDVILGYPAQASDDSEPFPCNVGGDVFDVTCFGLYDYSGEGLLSIHTRFRYRALYTTLRAVNDSNPDTSAARVRYCVGVDVYVFCCLTNCHCHCSRISNGRLLASTRCSRRSVTRQSFEAVQSRGNSTRLRTWARFRMMALVKTSYRSPRFSSHASVRVRRLKRRLFSHQSQT